IFGGPNPTLERQMEPEFGSRVRAANASLLSGRKTAINIGFLSALTFGVLLATSPHPIKHTPSLPDLLTTLRTEVQEVVPHASQPSAYATEQAMSSEQLIARWEPMIDAAARRFDIP